MEFRGVLPVDAPDPRIEQAERLRLMPVPVIGLLPQPSVEELASGLGTVDDERGRAELTASLTYTLWRNPADRDDPVNLAEPEEHVRSVLDDMPPWPRPAWVVEIAERLRYPMLWEAVHTSWHRDADERFAPRALLVRHVARVLQHCYRQQEPHPGEHPGDLPPGISERAVRRGAELLVDGVGVPGVELDTDPFVYGVGAQLPGGGILTAVLPRDELSRLTIAFATRR